MILIIPDIVSFKDTRELYVHKASKKNKERVIKPHYFAILSDFMKFLVELVLKGHCVVLPNRCGTLSVLGKKVDITDVKGVSSYAVDWKKTKDYWKQNEEAKEQKKLIYHLNENTSQILYKFFWNRHDTKLTNLMFYKFTLSRYNKRTLAEIIKEGQEYKQIEYL